MRMIAIHAQDGKEGEENQIGVRAKPKEKAIDIQVFQLRMGNASGGKT